MRHRASWVLAIVASVAPLAMAQAQDGWTGTRLPADQPGNVASAGTPPRKPATRLTALEQGSQIALKTANCLISRVPRLSEALVMAPDDATRKRALGSLKPYMGPCMLSGGDLAAMEMRFSQQTLVGMLAQALLHKRGRPSLPAAAAKADYKAPWVSEDDSARIVDEMAVCLADRVPDKVAALLWSDPFDTGEAGAMAALQTDIGPCLQTGATLKTNRLGLRVALARAYFYRTVAPAALAASR